MPQLTQTLADGSEKSLSAAGTAGQIVDGPFPVELFDTLMIQVIVDSNTATSLSVFVESLDDQSNAANRLAFFDAADANYPAYIQAVAIPKNTTGSADVNGGVIELGPGLTDHNVAPTASVIGWITAGRAIGKRVQVRYVQNGAGAISFKRSIIGKG